MIMIKVKKTFQPLTSHDVCEIYRLLHREGIVLFPLTTDGENKINSTISNITGSSFGVEHYPSIEEKLVAYFYFIINNHAFTDGNKRTATLVFLVLCQINDMQSRLDRAFNLDALAVYLEQEKDVDHHELISTVAKALFR